MDNGTTDYCKSIKSNKNKQGSSTVCRHISFFFLVIFPRSVLEDARKFLQWYKVLIILLISEFVCFLFNLLILLENLNYRKKERQRAFLYWFISQMAAAARTGLVRRWEPSASSGTPVWVQEPKDLGQRTLLSQPVNRELNWKWKSQGLGPAPI